MPNIVFTKNANTFQFSKGRSYPLADPAAVNVQADYSDGGQLYAYNKGIQDQCFNLIFSNLTQTDYDNFDDWLLNVAVGPLNIFTFTDEDGNNHTVRLLDTENPLQKVAADFYSGTIRLRKEI